MLQLKSEIWSSLVQPDVSSSIIIYDVHVTINLRKAGQPKARVG